jgi:hypothetical protein
MTDLLCGEGDGVQVLVVDVVGSLDQVGAIEHLEAVGDDRLERRGDVLVEADLGRLTLPTRGFSASLTNHPDSGGPFEQQL